MNLSKNFRSVLFATSALAALAACSDATIESPGDGTPIIINPIEGGGGASGFAARATAPTSAADCPAGTAFMTGVDTGDGLSNFCALDGGFAGAIPLSEDPILIDGTVFVTGDLEIAAGQTFASASQPGVVDLLVVTPGATLNAVGNAGAPIIFTSMQDWVDDGMPNGTGGTGDWGGIAINGLAPLNECTIDPSATPGTAACQQNGEGGSGEFGGDQPGDSSGNYQFIRVQHAGFQFTAGNELNGIALQGVGNGTTVENIQVHDGADDGFEWFGGTVDTRNLIVTGAGDDSLDWTDGWQGSLQFAIVVQGAGNDAGIEGDNNGDTDSDAMPRSTPDVANITFIGGGDGASGEGVHLRAGTGGSVTNAIVTNFSQGFEFDRDSMIVEPSINSMFLGGNAQTFADSAGELFTAGMNNVSAGASTLDGVFPGAAEMALTPTVASTINPLFVNTDYIGAIDPDTTAATTFASGWTVPGSIPFGAGATDCPAGTTTAAETPQDVNASRTEVNVCVIDTPVTGDVRLTAGNLYRMDGATFVGIDSGADPADPLPTAVPATLSIDPGVTVFGNGAVGVVDTLIVTRGSQIFSNGSQVSPVIFTSRADIENGEVVRPGATGEIGGIAINGRAPLNECTIDPSATPGSVDCEQNGEGGSGAFGGATPDDNSGRLNFTQVRYAGFQFTAGNELNGIALQGAGSGTELSFIQILNGADDGVEWFGGSANMDHLVVRGAGDDSIDWTDGWVGALQYAIVVQRDGNDNGIEGDNNGDTSTDAMPRSRPIVANYTAVGGGDGASGEGALYREGTAGALVNATIQNFSQGFEFDNDSAMGVQPEARSIVVAANGEDLNGTGVLADASNINVFATSTLGPVSGSATPLAPGANETGTTAADPVAVCESEYTGITINPCGALESAVYVGALEDATDTWFAGWTIGL